MSRTRSDAVNDASTRGVESPVEKGQPRTSLSTTLSTHSLDVAHELADRIGIVEHGRLIGCGTLATLRKQASLDGSLEDVFLKLTEEAAAERAGT